VREETLIEYNALTYNQVARGLLAPQPTPGQTASAAALAAEAHARAVQVAKQRGRPENIVGAWSPAAEAQAAAGLESGGASWKESSSSSSSSSSPFSGSGGGAGGSWHYDAASPCDAPTTINRNLSFAKSAAVFYSSSSSSSPSGIAGGSGVSSGGGSGGSTGCARYAVAVGGDLGHFGSSLGSFEEHVVNAAHGDVDVFFYVSLDSSSRDGGHGGKLYVEQMKLLRLLKRDFGPRQKAWAIAAVAETASNATTKEVSLHTICSSYMLISKIPGAQPIPQQDIVYFSFY